MLMSSTVAAACRLSAREPKFPAMSWADTLGNMKMLVVDLLTAQPESALHEALNRVPFQR